ncbi:alpha/beta hydrolase [Ferruginibacter sp. SUN002]|uniref:alpha/beta hydrolase n=1 Tax=Ferruginibacter sp. SUN002 TaxID=2937789 RepID=UPI003D369399
MKFFKNILISSLLSSASFFCFAQKDTCIFVITDPLGGDSSEYYMASNANGWNPKDDRYKFTKAPNGKISLVCYFDKGTDLEFKFTKGSWESVECDKGGADIENHRIKTRSDVFWGYEIKDWKDAYRKHTASTNVRILDTAFFIPQLNRKRRIWIYLPKDYTFTHKRYPVLYMHDGQNLFDALTSGYGEWGVDECLDTLQANGNPACIVIGIDNDGANRMSEYNPYEFTYKGINIETTFGAEGDLYIDFLIQTLKPFIDKQYRTLSGKENTIVAGSSMGALISYYAMLKHPNVFGKAGVFSPAFWTAPAINNLTDSIGNKVSGKMFFYMGEQEGDDDLKLMNNIKEDIAAKSSVMIYSVIDPEGKHNEAAWRKWFPEFYKWIMADGFNNIIKPEE